MTAPAASRESLLSGVGGQNTETSLLVSDSWISDEIFYINNVGLEAEIMQTNSGAEISGSQELPDPTGSEELPDPKKPRSVKIRFSTSVGIGMTVVGLNSSRMRRAYQQSRHYTNLEKAAGVNFGTEKSHYG